MALTRSAVADYDVHEQFQVDTQDNEDHTFCGIMFSVEVKSGIPVEFLELESVSVRGHLGPLTVWVTKGNWDDLSDDGEGRKFMSQAQWTCVYRRVHAPSPRRYVGLEFDQRVRVQPGQEISMYVHSELGSDMAIVYDNMRWASGATHDQYLQVKPGMAHLCNEAFAAWHPWGSWRRRREFVGRLGYGTRYLLWNPEVHKRFSTPFQELVLVLLLARPREGCPISWCSDDLLFYILNMVRFDWVLKGPIVSKPGRAAVTASAAAAAASALLSAPPTIATKFGRRLSIALHRGFDVSCALVGWSSNIDSADSAADSAVPVDGSGTIDGTNLETTHRESTTNDA